MLPDWVSSVLQEIFGHMLYELLLAALVAALITWLRSKASKWATPLLYGITTFTAVLIIGYVLTGQAVLSRQTKITAENVEANVKKWSEDLGMSIERTSRQDSYFSYTLRLHNGDPIEVFRAKEKPGYLQFMSTISVAPEHQAVLGKLTRLNPKRCWSNSTLRSLVRIWDVRLE